MTIVSLVLSVQHIGTGRRLGTPLAAGSGRITVAHNTRRISGDLRAALRSYGDQSSPLRPFMLSTNVAERLGILDYAARWIEPRSGQTVIRVFRSVFVFSAVIAAVLNNDAAILLLTPLIGRCHPPVLSSPTRTCGAVRFCSLLGCGRCTVGDLQSHQSNRVRIRRYRFQ